MNQSTKSIITIFILEFVQICTTNAVPIVETTKEVIPIKKNCDCGKKSNNETMSVPMVDKADKTIKTEKPIEHIGHFYVEPIDEGKEAIIFPDFKYSEYHQDNSLGTGTGTSTGAFPATSFAKKQAFLNDAKHLSDDQDWNDDVRHDHVHQPFEHFYDHTNNYPLESLLHPKPGFTGWN